MAINLTEEEHLGVLDLEVNFSVPRTQARANIIVPSLFEAKKNTEGNVSNIKYIQKTSVIRGSLPSPLVGSGTFPLTDNFNLDI